MMNTNFMFDLKVFFDMEISNKVILGKNKLVVFLGDGTKVKLIGNV